MRPMLVVVLLELAEFPFEIKRGKNSTRSRHLRRIVPISRSTTGWERGNRARREDPPDGVPVRALGRAAADFFTVEVLTLRGLVRHVVFFVMTLKTRRVVIAGITHQPDETWMTQVARNLTAAGDGFLSGIQHVILDRDPLYTVGFRRLLRDSGVTPAVLPARSPNLNAFAERFVESVKSEGLDRMGLLGEGHLRAVVAEFVHHYHEERPHQGLENVLITPETTMIGTGQVKCRQRLGSLLKFYYREAA
jgi:transposase InsO family protein